MKAAKIYLSLIVIIFSEIIYASQVCYPIRMSTPDGGMIETQACYNLPDPASIPSIKLPETRIPEIHIPDIYSGRAMEINRQLSRLDNLPKLPELPKIPEFYNIPNKLNIDVDKLITISNQQFGIPAESPEEFIESLKKAGAKIDLEKIKSWEIIISSYKKIIPLEKEKIKKAKEDIKKLTDGLQKVTAVHLLASTREIDDTRSEIDSKLVGSTNNLIKKSNDREDKNKIVIRSEFGEEEIIVWESNQSKELKEAYSELSKINPKTDVEFELKNTGLKSFRLADESYRDGDSEAGDFYKNIGLSVIDALVGWDMVTGTVRDTYEAVTGKNLITGEDLDDFSRGAALVGVVTLSLGSKIGKGAKLLSKLVKDEKVFERSIKYADEILNAAKSLGLQTKESIIDFIKWSGKKIIDESGNLRIGKYIPPPKIPEAFDDLTIVRRKTLSLGGGLRKRWKASDGHIFEWDSQHGRLEKYNKRGIHLGEFDPNSGKMTKGPNPKRKVEP